MAKKQDSVSFFNEAAIFNVSRNAHRFFATKHANNTKSFFRVFRVACGQKKSAEMEVKI